MTEVVLITGTPGVGKTTIATELSNNNISSFNIFEIAKELDCILDFDDKRDAVIIDDDCVFNQFSQWIRTIDEDLIILEGHYADVVPEEFVRKVFVLNPPLEVLRPRLEERKYADTKIMENIEAHIMQECLYDAIEYYGEKKVVEITTTEMSDIINIISIELK